MDPLVLFTEGILLILFLFASAWFWARCCNNYSLVDPVWAAGIGLISILFILGPGKWTSKKEIVSFLILTWSTRLSFHLSYRIIKHHPKEDRRYQNLRDAWKKHEKLFSFLFFQAQAISIIVLAFPFLLIGINDNPKWSFLEIFGCSLLTLGIIGEAIADRELANFKKNKLADSPICQKGIWRYSRHPNYFFESLIWISFYLIIAASPLGWVGFYAPLVMLFLLLKVTGIPPAEASSLSSKGEAYKKYQQQTSIFIPWFSKK